MRFHDRSDAWGTASADFNARSVRYPIVRGNLTKEMLDVEVQIERLTNEVESIENDRRFFNWLDDFEKKIASFKKLKPEQKREALLGLITAVDVFMIEPQTHWLEIQFHTPLVGDERVYKDPKNKKLGHAIRNGQESFMVQLGQKSHSKKTLTRKAFHEGQKEFSLPPLSDFEVLSSRVHGQGVFATRHLAAGERLIEYVGEVITMAEAIARHPHDAANPDHTFYFHLDDGRVIDALHGGNASKWINHSCRPNCVPDEVRGRIFIMTRRPVFKGEELTFDYGLESDEPMSEALKARYACRCGAKKCRGTMLAT